jgi:hypothetical protein
MLFDDPSSSSPPDGDARLRVATRQAARTTAWRPQGRSAADVSHVRAPSGRAGDPRLIETAGAPAPEALRATAIAAAVVRELYDSGREVRFTCIPTGRVSVLLCDTDGCVVTRLTPARALEIATGEPLPGARRR